MPSRPTPDGREEPKLKQELRGWQIFMIAVSAIIGTGVFNGDGEVLRGAGPAGLLIALTVVGILVVAVMECLSELIQVFPAPNALVEYVHFFVDPDLATVVGIAYWFTWASTFHIQTATTAKLLLSLPGLTEKETRGVQIGIFYIFWPFLVMGINCLHVKWIAWIEGISGAIKLFMLAFITYVMYFLAGRQNNPDYVTHGIQSGFSATPVAGVGVCFAITLLAFNFEGVEVVALTAFEARALKDLRSPSRIIAYLIFYVYFAYTLSETLNIDWINEQLGAAFQTPAPAGAKDIKTGPVLFLAANQVGSYAMGYFFIGCLIFAALSGSNTALYVASRAMYGMTRTWRDERTWLGRRAKWLSRETKKGVPLWSVIVSGVCFWWIPLSQLVDNNSTEDLIVVMNVASSISVVFVWGSVSIAYLRYWMWLHMHRDHLKGDYVKFNRWSHNKTQASTLTFEVQPLPAVISVAGCFLVVYVFPTALWWNSRPSGAQIFYVYFMPIVLLVAWVSLKIRRRIRLRFRRDERDTAYRWNFMWVRLDRNPNVLLRVLDNLNWLKPSQQERSLELRLVTRSTNQSVLHTSSQPIDLERNGIRPRNASTTAY